MKQNRLVIVISAVFLAVVFMLSLGMLISFGRKPEDLSSCVQRLGEIIRPFSVTVEQKRGVILTVRLDFYTMEGTLFNSKSLILAGHELRFDFYRVPVAHSIRSVVFPAAAYTDMTPRTRTVPLNLFYTNAEEFPLIYSGDPFSSRAAQTELASLLQQVISHSGEETELTRTIRVSSFNVGTVYHCLIHVPTASIHFVAASDTSF